MILIGLIAVPLLATLDIYRKQEIIKRDSETPVIIQKALEKYVLRTGRYPRPANRNLNFSDANFGREAADIAFGTCVVDSAVVCWTVGNRDLPIDAGAAVGNSTEEHVLIGDVPYADLGLPLQFYTDGHGSKFTYAISRGLTGVVLGVNKPFSDTNGVIRLNDQGGGQHTGTASDLHYVIVTHGEDEIGAFGEGGTIIAACAGAGADVENCDNDGIFNSNFAIINDGTGVATYQRIQNDVDAATYYDDYIFWSQTTATDIWTRTVGTPDMYFRNADNIRVGGAGGAIVPSAKLHIIGNLQVEGEARVNRFCDPNLPGGTCPNASTTGLVAPNNYPANVFTPSIIAGPINNSNRGVNGGGISCPNDVPLIGIANSNEVCGSAVNSVAIPAGTRATLGGCAAGTWPRGTDATGRFICATP